MPHRFGLAVALTALALLVPAGTANAKYCGGMYTEPDLASWGEVTVRRASCPQGFALLMPWAKHAERRGRGKVARLSGWTCRYTAKRGAHRRHGRVNCRRGARRVRFYGYDKGGGPPPPPHAPGR